MALGAAASRVAARWLSSRDSRLSRLLPLQSLFEFLKVRHEPDLIAAVRLIHEVSQRAARRYMPGDVADDCDAQPVRHELLEYLASDAFAEPEEIILESFNRNKNQTGFMLDRLNNQFDCITVALNFLPIWRAGDNQQTMQMIRNLGHRVACLSAHSEFTSKSGI